jgi:hypothetical protein
LSDYVTKTVALLGTRGHVLGRRRFPDEAYRFDIEFEKPVPRVFVGISVLNISGRDSIFFREHPRQPSVEASGDRRERTTITQRTILAVANVLRM